MQNNSFARSGYKSSRRVYSSSQRGRKQRPNRQGGYINPEKFINKATARSEVVEYEPTHRFVDFALSDALKRNIVAKGYEVPTPIQDQSIPAVLEGRDLIGLANTGTGKTAAFLLPIINNLMAKNGQGGVLIVAPTRELAVQIDDEFKAFAKGLNLYSALCVGGANMQRQIRALARKPQFVIGTPGRLKDLVGQGALRLNNTNHLVLDEADRMLDMGFIKDIQFLIDQLPKVRQSLCFSATITPTIERLIQNILNDPVTVSVRTTETSEHVEQDVIRAYSKDEKLKMLIGMLKKPEFEKVLVFGETKWGVQRLADTLTKQGLKAAAIHGNKSQSQRQRALDAFKKNDVRILVATDVAARGLDIPNVSHVINFDQPGTYEDYIHRIGRTGRAGNSGQALTFVGGSR
ncbi:DEAD/DEAH box helicase [Candidatus Saccharibacteria bacterium]|nr:DEAD/DEAH box helicase [Candidatus Saccharibacteria bacterium]